MASFINPSYHVLDITLKISQLSKKQDFIISEQSFDKNTGELFNWVVVFDGHGSNDCINFIREIPIQDMIEFIISDNPIENLSDYINKNLELDFCSGSTMCLIKFYSNRIICINCGDSQAAIYKNGKLEFISEEHNFKNEKEKIRLGDNVNYLPSADIKIEDKNTLISVYSEYIEWEDQNNTKLSCSQCLGHNGITGCVPDIVIIPITKRDRYKVILGSDGLWDMVMKDNEEDISQLYEMDAEKIMNQTVERWLQPWNMIDRLNNNSIIHHSKYKPYQCDDIAVVVVDIIPIIY
jgi:serine/threonine protein phosphatase PrpC